MTAIQPWSRSDQYPYTIYLQGGLSGPLKHYVQAPHLPEPLSAGWDHAGAIQVIRQQQRIDAIASALYRGRDSGATIDVDGIAAPPTGYYVSVEGAERVVATEAITWDVIRQYVADYLVDAADYGLYLGLWCDGERVYLDLTDRHDTLYRAAEAARTHGQQAIYYADAGVVLPTTIGGGGSNEKQ